MGMSIQTNVSSLEAQRQLFNTQMSMDSSLAKLSSGFRITKAGDDAAGLAISSNLQAQIRSYNQASRNASDGVSLIQTAEGALNESTNIMSRLRELASQASSAGVGSTERGYIQNEVTQLISEVDRIANSTEFNGQALLNGSTTLTFQVGIRNVANNDRIAVSTVNATSSSLGLSTLSLSTQSGAQNALSTIDSAMETINSNRATLGAAGNRFTSSLNSIQVQSTNLSAANSRIRDVDVAEESSKLSRSQILLQAGVATLSQANQIPQIALRLLG
jgi:flagellin